jgi:hemerythrin superfamily protein
MARATKRKATKSRSGGRAKTAKAAKRASARGNSAARGNGRAKASRGASAGREPQAIQLLKQDHRTVEELFEEFEQASRASEKRSIAREICQELTIHTMIEEEIFYPAVKDVIDEEIYGEAHVEHDGAKVLIAEILAADPSDEFYDARVKVLSEMIKHHVKEEEQRDGMFAQARRGKGRRQVDFDDLAERMETRKEDLTRLLQRNGIPAPEARTMHGAKVRLGQPHA